MSNWLILLIIALIINLIGFKKFVWFLSIGYAFSVAGLIIGMAAIFSEELTIPVIVIMCIATIYSLRLGLFLTIRELRSGSYKKVLDEATSGMKKVPIFVSLVVWIIVALLYFAQVSPLYFRLENKMAEKDLPYLFAGIVIMFTGLLLQWIADSQKSRAKKNDPNRFCDIGLYKIVRCPNYLGEILVWTGMFIGSVTCLTDIYQWLISLAGYIGIVFVMFNGARRLEKRQTDSYGNDSEFLEYTTNVPILIPILPIYSLKNWKFLG
jgi:steroid 5-alpha reductase family enzyme